MDEHTRGSLRNLAKEAKEANSARELIMGICAYLNQLRINPDLFNEIEQKVQNTSIAQNKFLISAWSGIKIYEDLHKEGGRNDLMRQLLQNDLPLEEAVISSEGHTVNLRKDRLNFKYFHNWLIKQSGFSSPPSFNRKIIATAGDFQILDDDTVTYKDKAIRLTPQQGKLLRELIKAEGRPIRRSRLIDILWNDTDNTNIYLEDSTRTYRDINKRISNVVTSINRVLIQYSSNRWHVQPAGETSYKFVP